jgi:hypothetical protein
VQTLHRRARRGRIWSHNLHRLSTQHARPRTSDVRLPVLRKRLYRPRLGRCNVHPLPARKLYQVRPAGVPGMPIRDVCQRSGCTVMSGVLGRCFLGRRSVCLHALLLRHVCDGQREHRLRFVWRRALCQRWGQHRLHGMWRGDLLLAPSGLLFPMPAGQILAARGLHLHRVRSWNLGGWTGWVR